MKRYVYLWMAVWMTLSATIIWAQPPGGGDRPGGGLPLGDGTPNVEIPDIEDIELDSQSGIDVDVQSASIMATAQARQNAIDMPFDADTFRNKMDTFEVPEDWSQIATLTDEMPSVEEIQALKDQLPHDINIDELDIQPQSSATATSAIVGYTRSMLGLTVTPLYAGEYGDSDVSDNEAAQQTLDLIYSQLGADMQSLLTQADSLSGVAYWALLDDGVALLYTGDCEFDECTIDQQSVQVEITGGSAGVVAIYKDTTVTSPAEAQALVQSTFPYLATIELSETESSAGTAFFAFDVNLETSQVTAYYAGVYESNGKSLVYAVSGIGDAYINVLLGG